MNEINAVASVSQMFEFDGITGAPTIYNFNSHNVRVVADDEGNALFVAKDVAEALGYKDTEAMTRRLDDDQMSYLQIVGNRQPGGFPVQNNRMSMVTESGLYDAVLGSEKPEAKSFRKWVTGEVLPSIRKTGRYDHAEWLAEKAALELEVANSHRLLDHAAKEKHRPDVAWFKEDLERNERLRQADGRAAAKDSEALVLAERLTVAERTIEALESAAPVALRKKLRPQLERWTEVSAWALTQIRKMRSGKGEFFETTFYGSEDAVR